MSAPPAEFNTGLTRADLDSKQARFVKAPWGEFALYETGGKLFCAQAFCPHMEGPLFEGSISGGIVTCPWHSWRFELENGHRIDNEAEGGACQLSTCETRTDPDGFIFLLEPQP